MHERRTLVMIMIKNPIRGKKGATRADAVRIEWKRIFEKKETTPKERFKYENLLETKEGQFLDTKIGLKNVYSTDKFSKIERLVGGFVTPTHSLKDGYLLLKQKGIPVAEYRGIVKIRGKKRYVREKVRDITKKELAERFDEMLKILKKASANKLSVDFMKIDNLGVNSKNQIVIRDYNLIKKTKNQTLAFNENIKALEYSLGGKESIKYRAENDPVVKMFKKIDELKKAIKQNNAKRNV